jgi:hypothetical protein
MDLRSYKAQGINNINMDLRSYETQGIDLIQLVFQKADFCGHGDPTFSDDGSGDYDDEKM